MKKTNYSLIIVFLLIMVGFSNTVSTENKEMQSTEKETLDTGDYTYYWILGQLPIQTHVYLYAKDGAIVSFEGTIATPVVVSVPKGEFVSYNLGDIGYTQAGTEWYFLEMFSDNPIMVNFDRAVYLKTGNNKFEWKHGDQLLNMPMLKLSTKYYFAFGGSGTGDDVIAMYAHEPTQITARAISNSGIIRTKTVTIDGLYISDYLRYWFVNFNLGGYGVTIDSDKPIAAACYDELGWWPDVWQSDYFFSGSVYTEQYNEFMHVHSSPLEYQNIYTTTANTFEYYDINGNLVGTKVYNKEASRLVRYYDVGYGGSPDPFLVHTITSNPHVESHITPTEWSIKETAAFMGWNTSYGELQLYADQDSHISILNGRNNTQIMEFDLPANTIFREILSDIGFDPNQPFLVVIDSDVPIYQAVKIPFYLRLYPAEVAPSIFSEPKANAGPDQTINENNIVQFNGSSSFDPDGIIVSYEWDFDASVDSDSDGNPTNDIDATGPTPTHIYGDDGVYVATLKVTDNDNLSATDICNITVLNVNPNASLDSILMDVKIDLRVAGSKWSNVGMTLYEDDVEIGYLEEERWPGNPDDNPTYENPGFPTTLDLTKSYNAIVTYDPYPDSGDEIRGDQPNNGKDKQNNAGNPVWVIMKFPNGSEERIHHTFNTQQSKKRGSDHWNHVDPWEVNIMSLLVGHSFEVSSHVTDPGSDDEILTYNYGSQVKTITNLVNPPNLDPYPSPEINPRDIMDYTQIIYEGPGTLDLLVEDDDGGLISTTIDLS
jgi:hypothetical protein